MSQLYQVRTLTGTKTFHAEDDKQAAKKAQRFVKKYVTENYPLGFTIRGRLYTGERYGLWHTQTNIIVSAKRTN